MRARTVSCKATLLPTFLLAGLALRAFGAEGLRPPSPAKEVTGRTFTAEIPTHWNAWQVEYRDKTKDWLNISDATKKDRGTVQITIRLLGPFSDSFPTPLGATGPGKAVKLRGVRGQEWIHTSGKPHHLLGQIRTVLIVLGTDLYSVSYFLPTDSEQNGVIDQIILSLKSKNNVSTR